METICFSLAPIQGITDYTFRNIFSKHFKGFSKAYAPFVRFQNGMEMKKSQIKDLLPENNAFHVIPQILSNKADEIIYFANYVEDLAYRELNWNLGCPFPMVARRQMGSGLLPFPEKIENILEQVCHNLKINLSIKMRLGYSSNEEIFPILEILNKFPVSGIIIHPRIGLQMYKGDADIDLFERCFNNSTHKLCYNGDIKSTDGFNFLHQRFPALNSWMIGRSAISNPFLIEEIISDEKINAETKMERFSEFHSDLVESYSSLLSGPGHLLLKMEQFWDYFSLSFRDSHKVFKMVKKANSITKFNSAIHEIFNLSEYIG